MKKNKVELVKTIAEKGNYYQNQISQAMDDIFDQIAYELCDGNDVVVRGFGTFKVKLFPGKIIKDVNTGRDKKVDPYYRVSFFPCEELRLGIKNQDVERFIR